MEFQFGTNWSDFSKYAGGVIGQTLAMEGMFAFFLESAFVGALIWGEKRLGPRGHFAAAIAVALGSWISGYFILVTNAFMQHPVGYQIEANGSLGIAVASAPAAFRVRVWHLMSRGRGPRGGDRCRRSFVLPTRSRFDTLRRLADIVTSHHSR